MTQLLPRRLLLVATIASVTVMPSNAAFSSTISSSPPSLCNAQEEVVFACTQAGKTISLCAAPAPGEGGRTQLRYAYGRPGKVELEISQAARPGAFTAGVAGLAGGGIDFVRVRNGAFAYVVYTGQTLDWSEDGWIVEAQQRPISHHVCKAAATGDAVWGPVYAAKLPRSPDSATFRPPVWVGSAPSSKRGWR